MRLPTLRSRAARTSVVVLALLAVLLTGACTGDDDPSPAPTTSATGAPDDQVAVLDEAGRVEALQVALRGEHAAVHLYRVSAGPLRGAALDEARAAIDVHRARRDALTRLLADAGVEPAAALPSYPVPAAAIADGSLPRTRPEARAVLAEVESGLVDAYVRLAAAADAGTHDLAVQAQLDSGRRAQRWSGTPSGGTAPSGPATSTPATP